MSFEDWLVERELTEGESRVDEDSSRVEVSLPGFETAATERLQPLPSDEGASAYLLDVPESIPSLGYASHQFFRYYGKFPSVVGREIVRKWTKPGDKVLDCYVGSGTTLVEAQIVGLPSFGIDINPLAVLASNVKTSYFDYAALRDQYERLISAAMSSEPDMPPGVPARKLDKWFSSQAQANLGRLRAGLRSLDPGLPRDFLTVAFLSIVRRTSNAYDGEVRPHINAEKKPRPPFRALADKFEDMLIGLKEFDSLRAQGVPSHSVIGDNRRAGTYARLPMQRFDLVVAHPPYLNSFNYLQVYSLELWWAEGLPEVWRGWSPDEIRALEQRAWPATDASLLSRYYTDLSDAAAMAKSHLSPGGVFALVIGDTTILGNLEPVIRKARLALEDLGFVCEEIWFRTTHYGIGKYAYRHRADYHGDAEKRDAIAFYRVPPL